MELDIEFTVKVRGRPVKFTGRIPVSAEEVHREIQRSFAGRATLRSYYAALRIIAARKRRYYRALAATLCSWASARLRLRFKSEPVEFTRGIERLVFYYELSDHYILSCHYGDCLAIVPKSAVQRPCIETFREALKGDSALSANYNYIELDSDAVKILFRPIPKK